jgi:hypothetical protein
LRAAALWGTSGTSGRRDVKHYRVNKLAKPGGHVVKHKDILASNDREAVQRTENDPDCPVCDVWHAGEKIGSIT